MLVCASQALPYRGAAQPNWRLSLRSWASDSRLPKETQSACPAPLPQQWSRPYRGLMQARTRKLIGTAVLLVLLGAYAWAAVIIGAGRITLALHWAQLLYFAGAGLLWSFRQGCSFAGCSDPTQAPKGGNAPLIHKGQFGAKIAPIYGL